MDENMEYQASIRTTGISSGRIEKDVTEKINNNEYLTVNELIDYLIKDNGFSEPERDIRNSVESIMNAELKDNETILLRAYENGAPRGQYLDFTDENGFTSPNINLESIAKNYFKPEVREGIEYNTLNLEVEKDTGGGYNTKK
jgi:Na+-translocating ferredoxin:NAD+ oxidoreductase RnfG subunit